VHPTEISAAVFVAQALLNAMFLVTQALRPRNGWIARAYPAILTALCLVAVATYFNFFRFHEPGRSPVHYLEFYNYYVGTKYFRELGYNGLYEATVIADIQDDPGAYDPQLMVRLLTDYTFERRHQTAQRAGLIEGRFTPQRWAEFKRDIAVFRSRDLALWRSSNVQLDRGYNGPPLVTMILGSLANRAWMPPDTFIRVAAWLDPMLIAVAALIGAVWAGWEVGLLFVFLWAANPFTDYSYLGGAYLRFMHVVALFLGAVALQRGRSALAGASFAFAALARVYPALFAAGVVSAGVLSMGRKEEPGQGGQGPRSAMLRFAGGFALTSLLLIGLSSLQPTPNGENPWKLLGRKLATHKEEASPNSVGLRSIFAYDDASNMAEIMRSWPDGRRLNWNVEGERTFSRRQLYFYATTILGFLTLVWLLRRGRLEDGAFAGIVVTFAWLQLSHYDYAFLCIVPFLFIGRRDALVLTSALFMLVAVSQLHPKVRAVIDFKYMVASTLIAAWLVGMLGTRLMSSPRLAPVRNDGAAPGRGGLARAEGRTAGRKTRTVRGRRSP